MAEYVSDYKINVFEVSWLSDEVINGFKSDFRIVANFFKQKRLNKNYIPDDPQVMIHVDEVLKLLSAMTGDKRYELVLSTDKEVTTMCEVVERPVSVQENSHPFNVFISLFNCLDKYLGRTGNPPVLSLKRRKYGVLNNTF